MERVRILAFDPGTASTGWGIYEGNISSGELRFIDGGVIESSKVVGDIRKRVDRIGGSVKMLIQALAPTHVTIEDYTEQGVASGTTYKDMSILIEHMRMICRIEGYEASIRTNAEWKRIAVGTGGLNKTQIQHFVKHHVKGIEVLGSRKKDTHIWDTAGIAYAEFTMLT